MLRVIREVKPTYVIGENVAGIINMVLDDVLLDLENEGYQTETFIIPACAVNAPHRRDRVWIIGYTPMRGERKVREIQGREKPNTFGSDRNVESGIAGYSEHDGRLATKKRESVGAGKNRDKARAHEVVELARPDSEHGAIANAVCGRQQGQGMFGQSSDSAQEGKGEVYRIEHDNWVNEGWSAVASRLCRVGNGVPDRLDRLKSLGNAVVPQVVCEIGKAIRQSMGAINDTTRV